MRGVRVIYRLAMQRHNIPIHMEDAIERYLSDRIEPGGFLYAVLTNNLKEACGRADHINRHALFDYVSFFYNEAPSTCWGSPEKVSAWLNNNPHNRREEI